LTNQHHTLELDRSGWGRSSVGRAPEWHSGGQGFEPPRLQSSFEAPARRKTAAPKPALRRRRTGRDRERRFELRLGKPVLEWNMDRTINLTVNGKKRTVTTDPQRPLLDVLREEFQLTGAKYGCGEGQCRACTVILGGKAVASCLTPIGDADKESIVTIEGLAPAGKLHPVQEAFLAEGAFQCGYCTSGMIMGMVGLMKEKPNPSDADILGRMQKHICRCCSYPKILTALKRATKGEMVAKQRAL
jgi:aerobic-type carbon monoxide dehydrogenase small subunit (CoxS/CutS family)